jgi:hypothetical protein
MGNTCCKEERYVVDFNQCFDLKCAATVISSELKRISRISQDLTLKNSINENMLSLHREHQMEDLKIFLYYLKLQTVLLKVKNLIEEVCIPEKFKRQNSKDSNKSKGSKKSKISNKSQQHVKERPPKKRQSISATDLIKLGLDSSPQKKSKDSFKKMNSFNPKKNNYIRKLSREEEEFFDLNDTMMVNSIFNNNEEINEEKNNENYNENKIFVNEYEESELTKIEIVDFPDMDGDMTQANTYKRISVIRHTSKNILSFKIKIELKDCISLLRDIMDTEEHYCEESLTFIENRIGKRLFKMK